MLRIHPFAAIRPAPSHESRVASVPYDTVSTTEARELAADNPDSFLHVVRSEIDLPPGTDPYEDAVYTRARENLDGLLTRGTLIREQTPAMYLYRQVWNHRTQVGLVCCCHVDDYENDIIRKHEKTRKIKEEDRTRHVLAVNANTGPVFLTYRDREEINDLMRRDMNARPLYHFVAPDGVTHSIWPAPDPSAYQQAFQMVPVAYVADGHHRAVSAVRAARERRDDNPHHAGEEQYNWFLVVLFPADQLTILSYNRVVRDLAGHSPEQLLDLLSSVGQLEETRQREPDRPGVFCFYLKGAWHRLEIDSAAINHADPVDSLDVAILQDRVLSPILKISDPRTDERIDFIGGIRGPDHLERLVDSGDAAIAFSLFPTTIDQLMTVADAGLVMPPKSTWFEPKLRSGLLIHALD